MKIQIIVLTALFAVVGCQTPVDDMLDDKFLAITTQKAPETLIGIWSGNMGAYLTGFNFKSDGRGIFCYSHDGSDVIQKVKYSNNIIYIQDGAELDIKKLDIDTLIVNRESFGGHRYFFYKDPNLNENSQFCHSKL